MCYRTYMKLRVSSHKQVTPELRKYQIWLALKGQALVRSQNTCTYANRPIKFRCEIVATIKIITEIGA
jgi:hypothetical protein